MWIPIKYHDGSGEKSSGNESDDSGSRHSKYSNIISVTNFIPQLSKLLFNV